jgi:RNA ligase (TIGR02306 family)
LVLPITVLAEKMGIISGDKYIQVLGVVQEGDDVTEYLGIVKYEPKIPVELQGEIAGAFPGAVHKTDEPRVQSVPEVLDELRGQRCYYTVKIVGTSSSFIHQDGEIWVCGHNWPYKASETNLYWRMCRKYGLEEKLKAAGNYAVQGEIAGPGVQKNHYGLQELQLFVFNVFDINKGRHLDYVDFIAFCQRYGLTTVPVVADDLILDHTVDQLLELAKGQYPNQHAREGIVIRTVTEQYSQALNSRASFKVINNDYLLKVKD